MPRMPALCWIGILLASLASWGCDEPQSGGSGSVQQATVGKCNYNNLFSGIAECKQYSGAGWTAADAQLDCETGGVSAPAGVWSAQANCAIEPTLGSCPVEPQAAEDAGKAYVIEIGGSEQRDCIASAHACTAFLGGTFVAASNCSGYGQPPMSGEASQATVFQWPTQSCVPALPGEPEGATNGEVCTWNLISGSTEEGRSYADYGSCEIVYTNRPYYPLPAWEEPPIEDPRYHDLVWVAESTWVASQVRASACSCCHSDVAPSGSARWSIDSGVGWVDTMSEEALALFAGRTDSSTLGAFLPADNNGFDRLNSAMPTTDVTRMLAFFEGEIAHRQVTEAFISVLPDIGGPLILQRDFVPEACTEGEGLDLYGNLAWTGGEARYLYVMDPGSENPGLPPNLDLPAGTLWRADVAYDVPAFPSGVAYGVLPAGAFQRYPETGAPAPLVSGQEYYLYVLGDVVIPRARCLFTQP
jgi:hypothetical protein